MPHVRLPCTVSQSALFPAPHSSRRDAADAIIKCRRRRPQGISLHCYSTRSQASAEYWIQFTARFGIVHMFGYNSAGSEPICMKSGALCFHCRGLALADFERDLHSSDSQAKFCFILPGKQCRISPIFRRPSFIKFEHNMLSGVKMKTFGTEFRKFYHKGSFFKNMVKFLSKI